MNTLQKTMENWFTAVAYADAGQPGWTDDLWTLNGKCESPVLKQTLLYGAGSIIIYVLAFSNADAFAALPGQVRLEEPAPVSAITPGGDEAPVAYGKHLVLSVRPRAERRFLLTGHMDTVFPATHPFQGQTWLDEQTLNGPGVADMKGGIAVILAALKAFEGSAAAQAVGYDVMSNSDEETGSLSSAPLIAQLAPDVVLAPLVSLFLDLLKAPLVFALGALLAGFVHLAHH